MNQLFEIEFFNHSVQSLIRATVLMILDFVLGGVTLFAPEVVLQAKETQMLYKSTSDSKFIKESKWDADEIYNRTRDVSAGTPFNELSCTNSIGINKMIAVVIANFNSQEHNKTTSVCVISDGNTEIDSKVYF